MPAIATAAKRLMLIVFAAAVMAGVITTTPVAQAATTTAPPITIKAYDHLKYRAAVKPSGFVTPNGDLFTGSYLTVFKGTTPLVRSKPSASLAPGKYTITSTFKYKKKIVKTAYRTVTRHAVACFPVTLIETRLYYKKFTGPCYDYIPDLPGGQGQGHLLSGLSEWWTGADAQVGPSSLLPVPDPDTGAYPRGTYRQEYSTFTYGPVLTKVVKRIVNVVKYNSSCILLSEIDALRSGMSLSRVQSILGNTGYRWSTSGPFVRWAFDQCAKLGDSTGYATFRDGGLYAW